MLRRVIQNVAPPEGLFEDVTWIFVAHQTYADHLESLLLQIVNEDGFCKNYEIKYVDQVLPGAACSVMAARYAFDTPDASLFIVNSDQLVDWDAAEFYKSCAASTSDGHVITFTPEELTPAWSYCLMRDDGSIESIHEKQVVSSIATVGMYYWTRGSDFAFAAQCMFDAEFKVNNEFYVAPVYNFAFDGARFMPYNVQRMHGLGVPRDLVTYLRDNVRGAPSVAAARTNDPVRIVAHRGNVHGPSEHENTPHTIRAALRVGYDVEIDVRALGDAEGAPRWYLGHDAPEHEVPYEFLVQPGVVCHAKNARALELLSRDARAHVFSHDADDVVLTSRGLLWTYPEKELAGPRSVAVMCANDAAAYAQAPWGVCTDHGAALLLSRISAVHAVDAVVFDLDGTLVETRELHSVALNDALREVAGEQYVITAAEHARSYDGLSTNQKLKKLNAEKNMPPELNKLVWERKQELTNEAVMRSVHPDARIINALRAIKAAGFPIGVASNCIRSSVNLILKCLGLYELVDLSVCNEDVERPKPHSDIYTLAAQCFGTIPERLLVVEDAPFGWQAARSAGCALLRVRSPSDVTAEAVLGEVALLNSSPPPTTVLIPLAASVPREHTGDGCTRPAHPAALDVRGEPAVRRVVESVVSRRHPQRFVFVVMGDALPDAVLYAAVDYAPCTIVRLDAPTRGALETCLHAAYAVEKKAPLLVCDGGHVTHWAPGDDVDFLLDTRADVGVSVVRPSPPDVAALSYCTLKDVDIVTEVAEKMRISDTALSGLYWWRSAEDFLTDARDAVESSRFYVAQAVQSAVDQRRGVRAVFADAMHALKNAADVAAYAPVHFARHVAAEYARVYDDLAARHDFYRAQEPVNVRDDERTCIAAYGELVNVPPAVHTLLGAIEATFSQRHVVYLPNGPHLLHVTVFKCTPFTEKNVSPFTLATAQTHMTGLVAQHMKLPFHIRFTRIVATRDALVLCGVPDAPLDELRRNAARAFPNSPAGQTLCSATLVRFCVPLSSTERCVLNALLENYGAVGDIGKAKVVKIDTTCCKLRMS